MIFSHVLYQLSYLAFPLVPCFLLAATRFSQKAEYNMQVFAGTLVETAQNRSCPRASPPSRFPTAPAGAFSTRLLAGRPSRR